MEKRTCYSEVVGRRGAIVFCELLAFCLVVVAVDPVDLFRTPVSILSTASPSRCLTVPHLIFRHPFHRGHRLGHLRIIYGIELTSIGPTPA